MQPILLIIIGVAIDRLLQHAVVGCPATAIQVIAPLISQQLCANMPILPFHIHICCTDPACRTSWVCEGKKEKEKQNGN